MRNKHFYADIFNGTKIDVANIFQKKIKTYHQNNQWKAFFSTQEMQGKKLPSGSFPWLWCKKNVLEQKFAMPLRFPCCRRILMMSRFWIYETSIGSFGKANRVKIGREIKTISHLPVTMLINRFTCHSKTQTRLSSENKFRKHGIQDKQTVTSMFTKRLIKHIYRRRIWRMCVSDGRRVCAHACRCDID